MHLIHDEGLDELSFGEGRFDLEERLTGEDRSALGYGSDVARETEAAQPFQKPLVELVP